MKIYIAGRYSGDTTENVRLAREAMVELLKRGHSVFCPHTMTAGLESVEGLDYEDFLRSDLDWLDVSDGILMLDGWSQSPGACREHEYALEHQIRVFYSLEEVIGRS